MSRRIPGPQSGSSTLSSAWSLLERSPAEASAVFEAEYRAHVASGNRDSPCLAWCGAVASRFQMRDFAAHALPYKGSAPMLADLAGGQVDIGFDSIATSLPHMQSGRLKGIAVSGDARSLAAPNLPTMAEAGLPGFRVTSFYAFVAPAATPKPIVERLSGAITALASTAEVRKRLVAAGLDPAVVGSDQLGEVLRSEQTFWADVVRTAGISPQ